MQKGRMQRGRMKVVTIGSATIDAIALIDNDRIESMSMRNSDISYLLLEQGRKVEAQRITNHVGGGGVNTAVGLARLGYEVACVAKMGEDEQARKILAHLAEEGVAADAVQLDPRDATGASILVGAHDRDISIFTYRGANTLLRAEDIAPETLKADLVYIGPLSNEAADAFPEIVARAKAAGAQVAANPGVRQLGRRSAEFLATLDQIDILSMNHAEAATLLPRIVDRVGEGGAPLKRRDGAEPPRLARSGISAGGFQLSLAKFAAALLDLGVGTLLITDGGRGAYAATGGKIHFRPAEKVEVAATVGAGDAFASTFAAWLVEHGSAAPALDAAAVNAASVVSAVDAQSGLLRRAALKERLAALGENRAGAFEWSMDS